MQWFGQKSCDGVDLTDMMMMKHAKGFQNLVWNITVKIKRSAGRDSRRATAF